LEIVFIFVFLKLFLEVIGFGLQYWHLVSVLALASNHYAILSVSQTDVGMFQFRTMVLNRGGAPPREESRNFHGGRELLSALQHGTILNRNVSLPNVTPVLILRR